MFDGFVDERIDVGEVTLRVRHTGAGPPVLLIHGHPRTGATWHMVAPRLVDAGFTVVCPDMRGYGQSDKAELQPDHAQQSKRAVARDMVRLMHSLGHPRFAVVGHDRGCYVALRAALDCPEVVDRLVVMDGVPITRRWPGVTLNSPTTRTTGSSSLSPTSRRGRSWPTLTPGTEGTPT